MIYPVPKSDAEFLAERRENTLVVRGGWKCDLCHIMAGVSLQYRSEMADNWQEVKHIEKRLYKWKWGDFYRVELVETPWGSIRSKQVFHHPQNVCKSCLDKYKKMLRVDEKDIGSKSGYKRIFSPNNVQQNPH